MQNDKIYLYTKDPFEEKLLINKTESTGIKCLNDSKVFNEYSNNMDDVYKNNEEYNPNKKTKNINSNSYNWWYT